MLFFGCDVWQVIAFDLVEMRKYQQELVALPEVIISLIDATGAACIGIVALSTNTMASVDSIRRVKDVEIAATAGSSGQVPA